MGPAQRDASAEPPRGRLIELGEAECLELLGSQRLGRLAVARDGHPEIFLVNYVLDERTLAFRTDQGTKLDWATMGQVAFEVDAIDPKTHRGWVVEVVGVGRDITDALDDWSEHVRTLPLTPWAQGPRSSWVAIYHPRFSGRRLIDPEAGPGAV